MGGPETLRIRTINVDIPQGKEELLYDTIIFCPPQMSVWKKMWIKRCNHNKIVSLTYLSKRTGF